MSVEASEHRLKALRGVAAGALPGKSLVVYEPASGGATSCRVKMGMPKSARCSPRLGTVQAGDLWIADRNFCTRGLLCDIDARGASFVIREPQGLPFEIFSPLRPLGRVETGHIAAQRVRVVDAQGSVQVLRRLRIK